MKKIYILSVFILAGLSLPEVLFAQGNNYRTTALQSRCIAETDASYNASTYAAHDSGTYTYSSKRGANRIWNDEWDFDEYIQYKQTGSGFRFNSKEIQTYDSKNNVLSNTQQEWDTIGNTWVNNSRNLHTYDGSDNLLSYINQYWDIAGSAWVNYNTTAFTFDSHNNRLTETYREWNITSSNWKNVYHLTYTYTTNNDLSSYLYQVWDTTINNWKNTSMYLNDYDINYNLLKQIYFTWNDGTSDWDTSDAYIYTYNASNLKVTGIYLYYTAGVAQKISKQLYSYNASGDRINYIYQNWDNSSSSWINSWQEIMQYNATHDDTTEIDQNWDASISSWINSDKYSQTYNADHYRTSKIYADWQSLTWHNNYRERYEYNSYLQMTLYTYDEWDNYSLLFIPVTGNPQNRYYYETYDTGTGVSNVSSLIAPVLYPNPADNTLTIDMNYTSSQPIQFRIYDMQARLWNQWQINSSNNYHATIPVMQLPAGNYYLDIRAGQKHRTEKFSIIH